MKSSSSRKQAVRKLTNLKGGTTMKGRVKLVAVGVLLAVMLASGVVMADSHGVTVPMPTNLTGSNEYPIGSMATFQWFNDRRVPVRLTSYSVVGPLPSTATVSSGTILGSPTVNPGVTYAPINVYLTWPGIAVGDQYVLHVDGQEITIGGRPFYDTFTFKIVSATPPSPSPSPGGHSISFDPFLLFLLMSQAANSHHNDTPASPTPPANQATGSIKGTLTLDDAVTDGVLIAYKDGTELMDILQGTAAAGSAYTAQTELSPLGAVTGVAKLELPTGKWNVLAMKACEDGQFWISEVKEITVFQYFTIPVKLPLVGKIQLEAQQE